MKLQNNGTAWTLEHNGTTILSWDEAVPLLYVGCGQESVDMYRGNYFIEDYVAERRPLRATAAIQKAEGLQVDFSGEIGMTVSLEGDCAVLCFQQKNPTINRFWFRVRAEADEFCYGCGEQMSYFNLRGRHFPLWTSEPGVGRDKSTYITWQADVKDRAGGDYYNTYFPQPTFTSSRRYYLHVDTTAYADFDFRHADFHELQIWEVPAEIRIEAAPTFLELLERQSAFLGRQPELPEWVYNGLIIGVQGGNERSFGLMERTLEHGIKVSGVWCQDWAGIRMTSFGKRLKWDWHYSEERYPDLPAEIEKLHQRGIKFLNYISCYLCTDGELYQEGLKADVFAKRPDGSVYLVDFGEFDCAIPDFTNPRAYEWFKNEVVKKHTLDIGSDGWMADFGEYTPTDDIVFHNGKSAMVEHNHWPAMWAKCNYDALAETGRLGEVLYFMRAGGIGSQKYCTLMWEGDQSVDFSLHDGLASVVCGALSLGMTGCGLTHSDIGGYTSQYGNYRTKELFLRWAEMAAFTAVMRTHECNRPEENFQYYDDEDCMRQLARLVDVYTMLKPYLKELVAENAAKGIPVQRPLFLHHEDDRRCYEIQYQYLLGPDVLAAPVYLSEKTEWPVYLPEGQWVHLWTGKTYGRGDHTVPAPLGEPPVFYRNDSQFAELFAAIGRKHGRA